MTLTTVVLDAVFLVGLILALTTDHENPWRRGR